MSGALSDERTGLSFTIAAGSSQRVILVSEHLGTRDRILLSQMEVFDPTSTRVFFLSYRDPCLKAYLAGPDTEHLASRFTFHRNDFVV
jgi:hypothetical protein